MKKHIRKISLILAAAVSLSALSSCGKATVKEFVEIPPSAESTETQSADSLKGPMGAPDDDPTWQLSAFENHADRWLQEDKEGTAAIYAVTDIDQNGLLEMLVCVDTGETSSLLAWEISEQSREPEPIELKGEMCPSIIWPNVVRSSIEGKTHFLFEHVEGEEIQGSEEFQYREDIYDVFKQGNVIFSEKATSFVFQDTYAEEGQQIFMVVDGKEISKDELFESSPFFQKAQDLTDWTIGWSIPEWYDSLQDMIADSYSQFGPRVDFEQPYELSIYIDPASDEWKQLDEQGKNIQVIEPVLKDVDRSHTYRIACSESGVHAVFEYGDIQWLPFGFRPILEDFSLELDPDVIYEFKGPFTDGIPTARLRTWNDYGRTAMFYAEEDGRDGLPNVVIVNGESKPPIQAEDDILDLCCVYAAIAAKYQCPGSMPSDYYWETAANAVTRLGLKRTDGDENGYFYLDQLAMEEILTALFPYQSEPEIRPNDPVTYRDDHYERYAVQAVLDEIVESAEVMGCLPPEHGYAEVMVKLPAMGDMDVTVQLTTSENRKLGGTFDWSIVGAQFALG